MEFQKIKEIEKKILENNKMIHKLKIENEKSQKEIINLKNQTRLSGRCNHEYGDVYEQRWSPINTELVRKCNFCDFVIASEHEDFKSRVYINKIHLQFF